MAKDRTEVGITGKLIPKPRTAKQQYELEKKRRMEKHLGKNVGGTQYRSDVTPYYNPRARTFKEFVELSEARRFAHKFPLSKDELATVQRIRDRLDNPSTELPKQTSSTKSARKVRKIDFVDRSDAKVREETEVMNKPLTPEERKKLKKMQTLHRLMKAAKAPKYQSDVAKEEYEVDEIYVLTPRTKSAKKVETSKSKKDPYGESPEDYRKRMKEKQQKEAINYDLEARKAKDAEQRYKEAKARKLAKRTETQRPLRPGEVRRYNPKTGEYESNLD